MKIANGYDKFIKLNEEDTVFLATQSMKIEKKHITIY